MALFGKKKTVEYCAICGKERKGGFLRSLFQTEIEDQYVCSDCYGNVDVQQEIRNNMTMEQFKAYLAFREENAGLQQEFSVTETVDLGILNSKILFDNNHGYMTLDPDLKHTVFRQGELRGFLIKEDENVIFEGNGEGLLQYQSIVDDQLDALAPELRRYRMERNLYELKLKTSGEEERERLESDPPMLTLENPFQAFHVELYFDHPYWNEVTMDMDAPAFDSDDPSESKYRAEYRSGYRTMENLANLLLAFVHTNGVGDATEEIMRLKTLLDAGAITEEEFTARKHQFLGL